MTLAIDPAKKEMLDKWDEKLKTVFSGAVPTDAQWTDPAEIQGVLETVIGRDMHIFLPGGGGEELVSSRVTSDGLIEWSGDNDSLDRYAFVVKPSKLVFWNPGDQTHEANFVLEVGALRPECPNKYVTEEGVEEIVELKKGVYAPRSAWDAGEYKGQELPDSARLLSRATKPARFAIFSKGSLYNSHRDRQFDAYSAHHNDPIEFKKIVIEMASIELV